MVRLLFLLVFFYSGPFALSGSQLILQISHLISEFLVHGDRDVVGDSDEEIDEEAFLGLGSFLEDAHQVARQSQATELGSHRQRSHVTVPW